jgi:hypothetical protein
MKFLIEGVEIVKGDQVVAQQCYNTILKSPPKKTNFRKKTTKYGK